MRTFFYYYYISISIIIVMSKTIQHDVQFRDDATMSSLFVTDISSATLRVSNSVILPTNVSLQNLTVGNLKLDNTITFTDIALSNITVNTLLATLVTSNNMLATNISSSGLISNSTSVTNQNILLTNNLGGAPGGGVINFGDTNHAIYMDALVPMALVMLCNLGNWVLYNSGLEDSSKIKLIECT